MYKGNKKRPKHMQESRHSTIHDIAVKTVAGIIARLVSGMILKLVDKYFS